jgi:hypothetical protein
MRIKQNKLGKPDYEYITMLKGNQVITRIYHEPQYCVMIETPKDKQCYPLTFEQYTNYCDNAEFTLRPNKKLLITLRDKAACKVNEVTDPNLLRFWSNVMDHYNRRLENGL